jgi:hypothetical protein
MNLTQQPSLGSKPSFKFKINRSAIDFAGQIIGGILLFLAAVL